VAPKLFLKNFELLFLEKYQHLYKALLAQSLLFVGFYHRIKYLHNLQSHPVYWSAATFPLPHENTTFFANAEFSLLHKLSIYFFTSLFRQFNENMSKKFNLTLKIEL
jgi:hypothetical protein